MSSDDLKKIKRIADIGADVHNALFEHIEENEAQHSQIIDKVDGIEIDLSNTQQAVINLQSELKTIELTPGEKGEQGVQGKQGIKGDKGEKGDKGDRGEKGEDGYNGIDGLDGKNGENGKDGKDGSPDTGEQIVEKINKQKTQIDASKIKNLPQPVINQIFEGKGGVVGLETIKQDGIIKSQSTKSLDFVDLIVSKSSDNVTVSAENKEDLLPATPTNPDIKYLNGNKEWVTVSIGAGGYAAPLYFTTADSDVAGYKAISYTVEVAETELSGSITNQEVLFRTYLFGETIKATVVDAGVWVANYRTKVDKAVGVTQLKFEVFLRHADNTETTLFSSYSSEINNLDYETIREESNQPAFTCVATDILGVRIYAKTTSSATVVVSTIVGSTNASYFTIPIPPRHNQLRDLAWISSGHTGTASTLAGYNGSGVATEYTEADYFLKDGSRDMTGQLTVIDGVFATPGINFVGASNTGIFRGSDGRIEFVIGGLTGLQIFSSQFRINDGSLASPGLSFGNETNSGLTRTSSGVFDFSINGDSVLQFTASQILTDKDFVVDTNLLFADQSAGYVGIGTATPANKFHVYHDINGDALMRIDNPNSGSSARAGLQFRNDILGTSNQFALMIAGTSYSTVSSWQNSGIMFSASGLTGGFHYAAYAGGIHFQTGGYGTSYDRLLIEDTTITANKMMKMIGGIMGRQTTISTATASIASNSVYLRVTRTSTGTCTITLTTAETVTGRLIIIKDAGTAGTNNITIDTQGTQKIDGADTLTIAVDKGYVALWCNGTGWDVLFAKLT